MQSLGCEEAVCVIEDDCMEYRLAHFDLVVGSLRGIRRQSLLRPNSHEEREKEMSAKIL